MAKSMLSFCAPFPELTANRLWTEYYWAQHFAIGRVADWSLMAVSTSCIEVNGVRGYAAWHIDREFAEKTINNNLSFLTTLISNTNKDDADLFIRADGGVEDLTKLRDEVQNGQKESFIDPELEEMLKTYLDPKKMKANRKHNKAIHKSFPTVKQPWYVEIFKGPLRRILWGLAVLAVCGVFPPLMALGGLLCIPFFFWCESCSDEWTETSKTASCDKCGVEGKIKVVKLTNRMYIPFLRRVTSIPYMKKYYYVCDGCLQKHLGEDNFSQILAMAKTDMATVKEITKKEYEELLKNQ